MQLSVSGGPTFTISDGDTNSNEVIVEHTLGDAHSVMFYNPDYGSLTIGIQINPALHDTDANAGWYTIVGADGTTAIIYPAAGNAGSVLMETICGARMRLVASDAVSGDQVIPTTKQCYI